LHHHGRIHGAKHNAGESDLDECNHEHQRHRCEQSASGEPEWNVLEVGRGDDQPI
jgi:hypothetical protein